MRKSTISADLLETAARDYLLSFDGVTNKILDRHLTHWKTQKHNSLDTIYRSMLAHATNRNLMPNVIGNIDRFSNILFHFNPVKVTKAYSMDFKKLLSRIVNSKIKTAGKIDPKNNKGLWVQFAKSALSCAKFLNGFESAKEFNVFVKSFYVNERSKLALPLLLKEELAGYGFALACDFLKETGFPEFVKPDTHLKDITAAAGITQATSDYEIFKDVVGYCKKYNKVPYEFDKLLWLVGSGKFYLDKLDIPTSKSKFIRSLAKL